MASLFVRRLNAINKSFTSHSNHGALAKLRSLHEPSFQEVKKEETLLQNFTHLNAVMNNIDVPKFGVEDINSEFIQEKNNGSIIIEYAGRMGGVLGIIYALLGKISFRHLIDKSKKDIDN